MEVEACKKGHVEEKDEGDEAGVEEERGCCTEGRR